MIIITATWQAKPGHEAALRQHLETMVEAVRTHEPLCLEYTLHQGLEHRGTFFFYEQYLDRAAIDVHTSTPHFEQLMAHTKDLLATPVDVQLMEIIK